MTFLHRSRPDDLVVVPYLDDTPRGVLATRSPRHPNPIGLTVMRLVAVAGATLEVAGVDLLDGTPVLDVKPYVPSSTSSMPTAPAGWRTGAARARDPVGLAVAGRYACPMRLGELAPQAEALAAQRIPFVQAIVVRSQRPTSVRPGDAAIVHADGSIDGFVGGVCAESSVRLHSLRVLETGEAMLLQLRPGEESDEGVEEDARAGVVTAHNPCLSGGEMEIFLEPCLPLPARGRRQRADRAGAARARRPGRLPRDGGRARRYSTSRRGRRGGRGRARPRRGGAADARPAPGRAERRPRGQPAARRGRAPRWTFPKLRAQLHSPAGLDIGARSPAEIAVSILAEIIQERHAAPAGAPEPRPAAPPVAVAVDPVCGMEVAVTDASLHLDVDGERHWFCCESCREKFAAEHAVSG